jgi:predicted ArsR family transcriptional regulator
MNPHTRLEDIAAVASISDPVRRSLFDFVTRSESAIGRDEASTALGIPRGTVAFHLDRLVESGLLATQFQRLTGKIGPGAGRPSKLYRLAESEVTVSVPERHYDLAAELLSSAIEESDRSSEPIRQAVIRVSTARGRALRNSAGSFTAMLWAAGYEPQNTEAGGMILTNCPFRRLALSHTELICQANLALLQGAADKDEDVRFEPGEGRCCVQIEGMETKPV